ncbi:Acetylxylan esterase / glucomannan deacetylase [Asticcacaulis sp. MM231]|uniref:lipolytic enzyme, G-D-S-L n=1 Tax=Asticcacaulis sp. MM231 TaxID=3157666 RepID=UPI0032D59FE8
MRYPAAVACCLMILSCKAQAQIVKPIEGVPADSAVANIHVGGRVVRHATSDGRVVYEHQWPGIYFESRFEGQRVYLSFKDTWNEYRLLIDDLPLVTIAQPGDSQFEVSDLPPGVHQVRLEKVTESIDHAATFGGFYIPADEKALSVKARARQIEFIGDSSMTGYGNRSASQICTSEKVRLTTDTQQGFAALTAKHFNADYQINAISGRGLIRNYGGFAPDYAMSKVYPFSLLDKIAPYEGDGWHPQIIMVKLNADYAKPLTDGEAWKNQKALNADYAKAFRSFAVELHRRYPQAAFLMWGTNISRIKDQKALDAVLAWQSSLTDEARRIGINSVGFVPIATELENAGCDYHPSLAGHRALATALTNYIEAHPQLWQGH